MNACKKEYIKFSVEGSFFALPRSASQRKHRGREEERGVYMELSDV